MHLTKTKTTESKRGTKRVRDMKVGVRKTAIRSPKVIVGPIALLPPLTTLADILAHKYVPKYCTALTRGAECGLLLPVLQLHIYGKGLFPKYERRDTYARRNGCCPEHRAAILKLAHELKKLSRNKYFTVPATYMDQWLAAKIGIEGFKSPKGVTCCARRV